MSVTGLALDFRFRALTGPAPPVEVHLPNTPSYPLSFNGWGTPHSKERLEASRYPIEKAPKQGGGSRFQKGQGVLTHTKERGLVQLKPPMGPTCPPPPVCIVKWSSLGLSFRAEMW